MMYKITKDTERLNMFRIDYFLESSPRIPLYTIENINWSDTKVFLESTKVHDEDFNWMHDLIRLLDKTVALSDKGEYRAL